MNSFQCQKKKKSGENLIKMERRNGNTQTCLQPLIANICHYIDVGNITLQFYNYKVFHSIFLLASDFDCEFMYIGVGCHIRISDGEVFRNSTLKPALVHVSLRLSPPKPLLKPSDDSWNFCAPNETMP